MGKRSRRLRRFMMNFPTGSRAVFAGDVVFGGVHSFMNDGHTSEWLASLEALEEELSGSDILYTEGHSGRPVEIISAQRRYLLHYRETVRRLAGGRAFLSSDEKEDLVPAMKEILPTDALEGFIAPGADGSPSNCQVEDAELSEESPPTPGKGNSCCNGSTNTFGLQKIHCSFSESSSAGE